MQRKSRSKKAKPKLLSKTQILREFELSSITWDWLEAAKVLELTRAPGPGMIRYEVDAEASKVLKMARNHFASFPGYRPPCLRYLMWSFLVMPLDDVLDDLAHRNINNRSLNHAELNKLLVRFMAVLPVSIQKLVRDQSPPETAIQQKDFDTLLKIIGIYGVYYNKTAFLERLYFDSEDSIHLINQVALTSDGSYGVKCEVLEYEFGRKILSPDGLATYQSLFMDPTICCEKSWKHYTKGYPPQIRQAYRKAVDLTTADFVVMTQIEKDEKRIYGYIRSKIHAEVLAMADSGMRDRIPDFTKLTGTMIKLDEHEAKIVPGAAGPGNDKAFRAPPFFEGSQMGEFSFSDRFGDSPLREEEEDDEAVVSRTDERHRS